MVIEWGGIIDKLTDGGLNMLGTIKRITFPNRLFLLLAVIFGLLMINIVPPIQAPDEIGHFIKAYAFSELKVKPQAVSKKFSKNESTWGKFGFEVPYEMKSMNSYAVDKNGKNAKYPYQYKVDAQKIKNGEKAFIGTGGITNYFFVNYIPQIIGIKIGKALGKPIIWQYYAARYLNLIFYILIVSLAIKRFPFSKLGATILGLNPMALFLASSVSGDAMIIAVSFYFIAWISSLIGKETISDVKLAFSALLMVNLVLLKPTLIVLGMLFFLIPNKSFSINRKAIWGSSIFVACILFYVLWNRMMIDQQLLYRDFANPSEQVTKFLKEPSLFFENFRDNYLFGTKGDHIVYSFVGMFGLLDAPMGFHWVVLYCMTLVGACFVQEKDSQGLIFHQRVIVVAMMFLYTILTFFALYQIWNKVGRTASIEGLQGRYFIPTSLLIVPLFSSREKILNIKNNKLNIAASLGIILVLIAAMITLTNRYPVG
ncbi:MULTISPECIES: DUF2142 domain-containing protein [Enterococcus]|uniref:DUF2142 domain-containing protein n=1 Tax=Enterococcus TaxID=1350 RepID=UPI000B6899A2|nr:MULTISPECIES: DUF2142 domain-containing protein [Enterococcus]OTO14339.1 hypothetical protein A5875_003496 [Enterococcus sp. 3H8_DIV0648]